MWRMCDAKSLTTTRIGKRHNGVDKRDGKTEHPTPLYVGGVRDIEAAHGNTGRDTQSDKATADCHMQVHFAGRLACEAARRCSGGRLPTIETFSTRSFEQYLSFFAFMVSSQSRESLQVDEYAMRR